MTKQDDRDNDPVSQMLTQVSYNSSAFFFFLSVCVTEQLLLFYTTMKDGTLRQNNTPNSMRCIGLNLLQSRPFIYLSSLHKLLPAYFLVPPHFLFKKLKPTQSNQKAEIKAQLRGKLFHGIG